MRTLVATLLSFAVCLLSSSMADAARVRLTYTLSPLTKLHVYADNFADDNGDANVILSYELIDARVLLPIDLWRGQQNSGHLSIQSFSLPRGVDAKVILPAPDSVPDVMPDGVIFETTSTIRKNIYEEGFFVVRHDSVKKVGGRKVAARFANIIDIVDSLRRLSPQRYHFEEPPAYFGFKSRHFSFAKVRSPRLPFAPFQDLLVSIADENEFAKMRTVGTVMMDSFGQFYLVNDEWVDLTNFGPDFELREDEKSNSELHVNGKPWSKLATSKTLNTSAYDWPGLTGNRIPSLKPSLSFFPTEGKSAVLNRKKHIVDLLKSIKFSPQRETSEDASGKKIVIKNPLEGELDRDVLRRLENDAAAIDAEADLDLYEPLLQRSLEEQNQILERSGLRAELTRDGAHILAIRMKVTAVQGSRSKYAVISIVFNKSATKTSAKKAARSTWIARFDSKTDEMTGRMLLPRRENLRDVQVFPGGLLMDAKGKFLNLEKAIPGRCELLFVKTVR